MSLLEVSGVNVAFGGLVAVRNVSLGVDKGEVCAIIGPNGAGKTTLFNTISGHAAVSGGRITLAGKEIQNAAPHAIAGCGVRRTFQNGGLFGELTVLENVMAGMHAVTRTPLAGTLLRLPMALALETGLAARARALLDLMEARHLADYPAASLSGGQQRMVEIVRAIAAEPPLLLLDEPAVGLSPPMRDRLAGLVRKLAREQGLAILIIEHAIELVMSIADRVVVMNQGVKIADDTPAKVRANRDVLEAYLGHA
jgi:branched-chain amino acid transport system ATP-binding protein